MINIQLLIDEANKEQMEHMKCLEKENEKLKALLVEAKETIKTNSECFSSLESAIEKIVPEKFRDILTLAHSDKKKG